MAISVILAPIYKSTVAPVAKAPVAPPSIQASDPHIDDWCELAREGEWEAALLTYLRGHGGEKVMLWRAINEISASTLPEKKWMLRETRKRLLEALGDLIRLRKVARWRRSQIRALDIEER